jgi:nucleobase transporter 1/2
MHTGVQLCKLSSTLLLSLPPCRHLSPITIAVNISILGLSLYGAGWPGMGACIQLGLPVLVLIIAFAFHMRNVKIFG